MPSSVWNLSPRCDALDQRRDRLGLVARGREVGDELEVGHPSDGTDGVTMTGIGQVVSASPVARLRLGLRARQLGPDRVDLALRGRARSPALSTTQVATSRRSSSVACSAMRRSASSRRMPRASSRSRRTSRGASTTITASYSSRASTRRAAARRARRSPSARRRRDLAQELLADRRVRDRLELLARLVGHERLARRARPGRATRRPRGSRGRTARRASPSAGVPGSTTSRAIASASTTTAPRAMSICGDRRLPRPDPARQPHHQHAAESSDAAPQPASGLRPASTPLAAAFGHIVVVWSSPVSVQTRGCHRPSRRFAGHFPSFEEGSRAPVRQAPQRPGAWTARAVDSGSSHDSLDSPARSSARARARSELSPVGCLRTRQSRTTFEQRALPAVFAGGSRSVRVARDRGAAVVTPAPGPALLEITTSLERRPSVRGARMHRSGLRRSQRTVMMVDGDSVSSTPELTIYSPCRRASASACSDAWPTTRFDGGS